MRNTTIKLGATSLLFLALTACGTMKNSGSMASATPKTGNVVALTASNKIITFNREAPAAVLSAVALTGIPTGEWVLGIDYRPADGALYAVASGGGIYTINPATGVATKKSQLTSSPDNKAPLTALTGSNFAVDFNPVADRLRVVSDTGQSLRINVDNGIAISDGAINGVPGARVVAGAYTNSYVGATATALYVINGADASIYLQNPPNNGTLTNPVRLGVTPVSIEDFDIESRSTNAYAVMTANGKSGFYWVDITNQKPVKVLGEWTGESVRTFALWQAK
jgi:hypothetical protein